MNKVLVLLALSGLCRSSPVEQTVIFNEDGSYKFNFDTGKDAGSIARHEERHPDGTVVGRYSYEDPTGSVRVVNYRAGRQGFVASGDVGVAGAPPAQVPAVVPPVPDQVVQEEPDQNQLPVQEQVSPAKPAEAEKPDPHHIEGQTTESPESPAQPESPLPDEEPIKVAIPEETGRKREAGSPPSFYSDPFSPFSSPMFGKRRLDIPDEEEKANPEDDTDKKEDAVKPPTSYQPHYVNPFIPQPIKPSHEKHPSFTSNTKPADYYYYVPVSPNFGYFPGSQPSQQPIGQSQVQNAVPKAWAYVPLSAFPQQNAGSPYQPMPVFPQQNAASPYVPLSAFPQQGPGAAQPGGPATNWVYIQPHAVNYIPGNTNSAQSPAQTPAPSQSSSDVPSTQAQKEQTPEPGTFPVQKPGEPELDIVLQKPIQTSLNRPTVHHYHFRGPSHTYGYYYQY